MSEVIEEVNLEKVPKQKKAFNRQQKGNNRNFARRGGRGGSQDKNRQQRRPPLPNLKNRRFQQNRRNTQDRVPFKRTGEKKKASQPQPKPQQIVAFYESKPNVVIKGLGSYVTDQKLREVCQGFGPMDMCKLDRDNFGNIKPQGIGLIKFEKLQDAQNCAKELDGVSIVEDKNNPGGLISAKFIDRKDPDWRRHIDGQGVLNIQRRTNFKPVSNRNNQNWRR